MDLQDLLLPPETVEPGKKREFTFQGVQCDLVFTSATEGRVAAKGKTYVARLRQTPAEQDGGGEEDGLKRAAPNRPFLLSPTFYCLHFVLLLSLLCPVTVWRTVLAERETPREDPLGSGRIP